MITFPAVLIFSCVCTAFGAYERLSAENAAVLLVDHQTGLAQLVRDYGVRSLNSTLVRKYQTRNPACLTSTIASHFMDSSPSPAQVVLLMHPRTVAA
jgi:hypothetical protein